MSKFDKKVSILYDMDWMGSLLEEIITNCENVEITYFSKEGVDEGHYQIEPSAFSEYTTKLLARALDHYMWTDIQSDHEGYRVAIFTKLDHLED